MKTLAQYCKYNYRFTHYKDGVFYFSQAFPVDEANNRSDDFTSLVVHVPVKDIESAELNAWEKGITLMKWIRKDLELLDGAKNV